VNEDGRKGKARKQAAIVSLVPPEYSNTAQAEDEDDGEDD
jgi:hypothetical protein